MNAQLQQLFADSHIVTLQPAEKWHFMPYKLSGFQESQHEAVKDSLNRLESFLTAPYLCDDFDSHEQRRRWRDTINDRLCPEAVHIVQHTCLRLNTLTAAYYDVASLKRRYQGDSACELKNRAIEVERFVIPGSREYALLPLEKKMRFIHKAKSKIYRVNSFFFDEHLK